MVLPGLAGLLFFIPQTQEDSPGVDPPCRQSVVQVVYHCVTSTKESETSLEAKRVPSLCSWKRQGHVGFALLLA